MRVLLVTSWGTACGIAAHSAALKESVERADAGIEVIPLPDALDPGAQTILKGEYPPVVGFDMGRGRPAVFGDLVHLNHHDALHSRWTPDHVSRLVVQGLPVLVTYHDTRSGAPDAPNSEKLKALAQVASSVVVHEPVADLRAIYWRQGVPAAATRPAVYYSTVRGEWVDGRGSAWATPWKAFPQQPVLGSVGFAFPWKNYDRLAQVTSEEGWALVLLANDATAVDEARWRASNPSILVVRKFLPQAEVTNYLAGCDLTAFMYECSNNGTSGAIRQGIAARKPVVALAGCRQFRDLLEMETGIFWVKDWDGFRQVLRHTDPAPWDARISTLAWQESWERAGQNYSKLYHTLVGDRT